MLKAKKPETLDKRTEELINQGWELMKIMPPSEFHPWVAFLRKKRRKLKK